MSSLAREFLFTSGKGGVGKTTVAVALSKILARRGRRVLLGLLDGGLGARLLGVETLSADRIERCDERLWTTLLDPEAALAEYGTMMLKSQAAYRALFQNRYGRTFLTAVPGLYQWAVLGKAWFHTQELDAHGAKRFDTVVVDAPATGHGLEMLRVPKLITEIAPQGLLRRDADLAWSMLTDRSRAGVVIVSLPEELAVSETLELDAELGALELPVAAVVVNSVHDRTFSEGATEALARLEKTSKGHASVLARIALDRACREASEQAELGRLSGATEHPVVRLPWDEKAAAGRFSAELVEALDAAL
jgi:anion-transporting  ArsA/GET3 family ATPase